MAQVFNAIKVSYKFFLTVLEDKYIGGQSRPIGKVETRRRSIDKIKVTLPFKY